MLDKGGKMSQGKLSGKQIVMNVVSIVCLVTGVLMAIPSFEALYKIHIAGSFRETTGVVVSSDIRQKKIDDKDMLQRYMPKIWYSYDVDRNRIISDRFSFNDGYLTSKAMALAVVEKYPAGAKIKVFYDERDPSFSVILKEGVPMKDSVLAGLGAFFILSGLIALMNLVTSEIQKTI